MPPLPGASPPQRESLLLFVFYFVIYLAVLVRMLLNGMDTGAVRPEAYGLMAGFLALSVAEPPLARRWPPASHVGLALMSLVIFVLVLTQPRLDYYAMLFVSLSIIAVRELPDRPLLVWLIVLCVLPVAALAAAFGARGASYAPAYVAGCLLIGLYGRAWRNAEAARQRSDRLRAELEEANHRLQAYAERAEEAAAEQERANLARDLHDAATQTVFSMNLTLETARLALANDEPQKVRALLDRLQELARDALAEMRTLVRELRPGSIAEDGLVRALGRLAAFRERRDGLRVAFTVQGDERGDPEAKETVFRTAREALTNVVRHAGVSEARVNLSFEETELVVTVEDSGAGFDPAASLRPDSFGLRSMRERLQASGGTLLVNSSPGAGTRIQARVPLEAKGRAQRGESPGRRVPQ